LGFIVEGIEAKKAEQERPLPTGTRKAESGSAFVIVVKRLKLLA
jgi:hypothetical protein